MKRKSLILVAFFLLLYIMPLGFMLSYAEPTIPAEQTTTKDFAISASWYNEDWHYRKEISIIVDVGIAGTDYQVLIEVTYDSDMETDFADIIFVDEDHDTLFDYWLESKVDSTSARFWVEVADYMSENTNPNIVHMYYGNEEASSSSDGTDTFLMYEDWVNETISGDVWDIVTADGSVSYSGDGATHGTIAKFEGNAGATYQVTTDYDTASPIAIMFRSNLEECGTGNTARQGSGWANAFAFNLVDTSGANGERFYVYDDDGNQDTQTMSSDYFDAWVTFQITRDGTNSKLYADDVLIETASCGPDIIATNPAASIMITDSEDDLYSDWVAVRKFIASEPYVDSWGEEENNIIPEWELISSVEIVFLIGVYTGTLDILIIFGGLVMIPASTLYLVKGGKDEMSSDKLFYGLIAFAIGWALVIGGIYA